MKRPHIYHTLTTQKWRITLFLLTLFSLLLIFSLILTHHSQPPRPHNSSSSLPTTQSSSSSSSSSSPSSLPRIPRFAYLISATRGEVPQSKRLLEAVYHPRNYYVIHLDADSSEQERIDIAGFAKSKAAIRHSRNVMVVGHPDLITPKGPTATAAVLHAAAIFLKRAGDWDWFFNLNAWDYPLFSQDDLLHIFSYLPRDLNFLEHTSDIGWKEHQRARPIIIDPGLYHVKKSGVFWAKEKRSMPSSFKLFTGSEWVVLTKSFLDFCIWGQDNLPRTLLMYFTNFLSSPEGYFHTVVCNNKNYQNTTVNHDLRYMKWDIPPNQQPANLTKAHYNDMVQSGAPFARRFAMNDPVLEQIDRDLLRRIDGHFVPGGWCLGNSGVGNDPCVHVGNPDAIKPSMHAKRLEKLVLQLLDSETFRSKQCR